MANLNISQRQRLDVYLMHKYPDFSRAFLQKLCNEDKILVDGEPQKQGYKLKGTEKIKSLHDMKSIVGLVPDIDIPIIYEDENVVVVNKPAGVLSHGLSKFLGEPSIASFLRQRLNKSQKGEWKPEDLRFGIVHRLDRVTSGIMICAKNLTTMRMLQKQFHDRTVEKIYHAIVSGEPKETNAIIDMPLERNPKAPATFKVGPNGKPAVTEYEVLKTFRHNSKTYSYIELLPKTGRTHQLRVHLSHIKTPIVGDFLYDGEKSERLYLHAHILKINIPTLGSKTFKSELPADYKNFMSGK